MVKSTIVKPIIPALLFCSVIDTTIFKKQMVRQRLKQELILISKGILLNNH